MLQRLQGFVAEHPADVVDVGIAPNQFACAAPAEHVCRQRLFETGPFAGLQNDAPQRVVGHAMTAVVGKEGRALRLRMQSGAHGTEITLEKAQSRGAAPGPDRRRT